MLICFFIYTTTANDLQLQKDFHHFFLSYLNFEGQYFTLNVEC